MPTNQWRRSFYSGESSNCIDIATEWRKSTFSEEASSCVYVAAARDGKIRLRESDDPHIVLTAAPAALRFLICEAKAGAFDRVQEGGA
ncbi:DUF397 domain-containing protein [Streptomyces malaysiensis]|uniref:DUF397 domain-containing protein n=1 Tax=Streptomyces malaysiensis TaxID=92644 RepID=UPI0032E36389